MTENEVATIVVDAAYTIHKRLGARAPGIGLRNYAGLRTREARVTTSETTGHASGLRECPNGYWFSG
jgi:hypothetical protein